MCVCVSARARLCVGCVHVCHCVCVLLSAIYWSSLCWFVSLFVRKYCWGVCLCVFYLSGCLSLCLVLLESVDLLVLSSSTCTAVLLPHLLGRREEGSNFVGGCTGEPLLLDLLGGTQTRCYTFILYSAKLYYIVLHYSTTLHYTTMLE